MGTTISVGHEVIADIDGKTVCIDNLHLQNTRELVWLPEGAMCGDIAPPTNRSTKGRKFVRGLVELSPTGAILDHLIPKLGLDNTSGTIYELAAQQVLPTWSFLADIGGALHNMTLCRWVRWGFRGAKGDRPIQFFGEFVGADETEGSQPLAKDPLDIEDIYAFTNISTFTIGGTSRQSADRFLLQVDHKPVVEYGWSTTVTDVVIGAQETVFATSNPYTPTHDDLYWTDRDDDDGRAIVLTMATAQRTMQISCPTAIGVARIDEITGKGAQIRVPSTMIAHRSDNMGTRVSPLVLTLS